jgi:myosin-5
MPEGSDLKWCLKLYDKHLFTSEKEGDKNHFSKPRMSQDSFIIAHFAQKATYSVHGFLEKNHDSVLEEQLKVLMSSELDFIRNLFAEDDENKTNAGYQ